MKNLKKVLALALAFAMSLTLFAGAAYTDEASIGANFADDVAMLSQLGVVGGYEDGSFRPQGNITRAETTKLIYVLKYGYDDAGKLFSGAKSIFTDVEGNANVNWAKGYINYCANQGIVGGIGNNKFNPNGNVTVAELSKMLLVSLGADAAKEGYGGSNWAANVVADAMEFGVFDGWTGDPTVPATRELACKLMANTIFAPVYVYSAITGTGSQYDMYNNKNQTLGEKTMGLKHVNGIVVANGRYAIDRDPDGQLWSTYDKAPTIAVKKDKSTIVYEVKNQYGAITGYEDVTIDVDLSDDVLGNLVDVYFKADGTDGNYSNITLVGDVLVNSKTVAYDVMAADIEITPDGDSSSSKTVKPAINFTTADGNTISVEPRAYYGTGNTASSIFTSGRVSQQAAYNGAAFADRIYALDATSINPESTGIAQPAFDEAKEDNGWNPELTSKTADASKAVLDMGENQLRKYRFVSVDGGANYSYIFATSRMDVGRVGTYNDSTINVSGAGGTLDLGDEAIVNGTVEKGMDVVTYAKDGLVYIEPTEEIVGKATNFRDNTATINGAIYRAAVAELGDEIDTYFTSGNGKNKNNENGTYTVYKNYVVKFDGTAVAGAATDYAVVLMSKYDKDTGVVTVRLGFADNTEGTYEVSKINSNEDNNEEAKWWFENNRMVGAVVRATIANGMANLSSNDYDELDAKMWGNANAVAKQEAIASIAENNVKVGSKTYRSDVNSIIYMIYGGQPNFQAVESLPDGARAKDKETATDLDVNDYVVDNEGKYFIVKSFSSLKARAFKLSNVAKKTSAPVYMKVAAEGSDNAAWTNVHVGDAVTSSSSSGFTTLVAGSISVGATAGAGIGETDNLAYLLKATANYNTSSEKWYMDVAMITANGLVATRTVDEVCDADGNLIINDNSVKVNDEPIDRGTIVVYEMTASEDEADTSEWIMSIGNGDYGAKDKIYKAYDNYENAGYYAVQIGIVDDEYIGFFPITHSQTGDEDDWADGLTVVEKDKYNFGIIAIDDTNFVEGGDIETISDSDEVKAGSYNAIIVVDDEGEITRVFSLYNNI